MKAFILAAGLGTRLRPLTENRPKVMLEVAGERILERTLKQLNDAGVTEAVINIHYLPQTVKEYFGEKSFGIKISYSHETELLGTAGGLKNVQNHFDAESEFIVVYGDNVYDMDFKEFINLPLDEHQGAIMLFDRNQSKHSGVAGGVVEIDENGYIKSFKEGAQTGKTALVNGGVYKFTPEIFKYIPKKTFFDFGRQVFPQILKDGFSLKAFVIKPQQSVFGIDTPESLNITKNYFKLV